MHGLSNFAGCIVALLTVFFFHELGHFLAAKASGVLAPYFTLGVGPVLFRITIGTTEYRICLLPFIASVILIGAPVSDDDNRKTNKQLLEDKSFPRKAKALVNNQSYWLNYKSGFQQLAISLAGPLFNFLLAGLIVFSLTMSRGMVTMQQPVTIAEVAPGGVTAGLLEVGDTVESINGVTLKTRGDLEAAFQTAEPGSSMEWVVRTPEGVKSVSIAIPAGNAPDLGVRFASVSEKVGPLRALTHSVGDVASSAFIQVVGIWKIVTGQLSVSNMMGPVGIISAGTQMAGQGFLSILFFAKMLSIGLGVINLVPVPPLDGARAVFALWRIVTGRPVPSGVQVTMENLGTLFFLALFVAFIVMDTAKLFPG